MAEEEKLNVADIQWNDSTTDVLESIGEKKQDQPTDDPAPEASTSNAGDQPVVKEDNSEAPEAEGPPEAKETQPPTAEESIKPDDFSLLDDAELPKPPQEEDINQLKAELDQAKKALEHPFIKEFNSVKDAPGFDFEKFIAQYQSEDFSRYSFEDLVRKKIETKFPDATAEEIQEEVDDEVSRANTQVKRKEARLEIETLLKNSSKKSVNDYAEGLKKSNQEREAIEQAEFSRFVKEFEEIKGAEGKKVHGVQLTKDHIERFEKITNGSFFQNPDGSVNYKKQLLANLAYTILPDLLETTKKDAKVEAALERSNADTTKSVTEAHRADEKNPEEQKKEVLNQLLDNGFQN